MNQRESWSALWPALACASFPVISLYAGNIAYTELSEFASLLGFTLAATAALHGILLAITKDVRRAGLLTGLVALSFFLWGHVQGPLVRVMPSAKAAFLPYALLTLPLCVVIAKAASREGIQKLYKVVAATLLATSLFTLGRAVLSRSGNARPSTSQATAEPPANAPDIFYIILDGYGRTDTLKRYMGYDDSAFVAGLKARGFYVADKATSNYSGTLFSLGSSLNMDYLQNILEGVHPEAEPASTCGPIIQSNEVTRYLQSKGYLLHSISSGYEAVKLDPANVRYEPPKRGGQLTLMFRRMTPIGVFSKPPTRTLEQYRAGIRGAWTALRESATPSDRPRFVFAHILAPHPPFVFNPDGSDRPPDLPFEGVIEGPHFREQAGSRWLEIYRAGYRAQAGYAANQALAAVDAILKQAKRPPVIILQGDHGSRAHIDRFSLSKSDPNEFFPILNAYYAPAPVRAKLYPSITPVNSFRVVLDALFTRPAPLLEERSYYNAQGTPFAFFDATEAAKP